MLISSIGHFSGYIDGLGDAVEKGLVKAVGVSNYSGNSLLLLSVLKSSILCKTMYQFYREKGNSLNV